MDRFDTFSQAMDFLHARKTLTPHHGDTSTGHLTASLELSLAELKALADSPLRRMREDKFSSEFYNASSYQAGVQQIDTGSPDTYRKALAATKGKLFEFNANHDHATAGEAIFYSDEPSGTVDLGAYLSGAPDFYLTTTPAAKRIISISVGIGVSAGTDAKKVFQRGALILAAIEALESSGYGVQLIATAFSTYYRDGTGCNINIMVKRPDEYISKELLTYYLCDVAAFRCGCFAVIEQFSEIHPGLATHVSAWKACLGSTTNDPREMARLLPPGTAIVPHLKHNVGIEEYKALLEKTLQESIGTADNR